MDRVVDVVMFLQSDSTSDAELLFDSQYSARVLCNTPNVSIKFCQRPGQSMQLCKEFQMDGKIYFELWLCCRLGD